MPWNKEGVKMAGIVVKIWLSLGLFAGLCWLVGLEKDSDQSVQGRIIPESM